jgi:hypothetical protein
MKNKYKMSKIPLNAGRINVNLYVCGMYLTQCETIFSKHYSWDYAQVHFPQHAHQVGPIYFKTPRKCSVFGVCSEEFGNYFFFFL